MKKTHLGVPQKLVCQKKLLKNVIVQETELHWVITLDLQPFPWRSIILRPLCECERSVLIHVHSEPHRNHKIYQAISETSTSDKGLSCSRACACMCKRDIVTCQVRQLPHVGNSIQNLGRALNQPCCSGPPCPTSNAIQSFAVNHWKSPAKHVHIGNNTSTNSRAVINRLSISTQVVGKYTRLAKQRCLSCWGLSLGKTKQLMVLEVARTKRKRPNLQSFQNNNLCVCVCGPIQEQPVDRALESTGKPW